MRDNKYIVLDGVNGVEVAILFPEIMDHSNVANAFANRVVSAGKVSIGVNRHHQISIVCYGRSTTLNKGSRGREDSELVAKTILNDSDDVSFS